MYLTGNIFCKNEFKKVFDITFYLVLNTVKELIKSHMKRNILFTLLPLSAGVALTGTGFSIWVFDSQDISKTVSTGVQIESAVGVGIDTVTATVKNVVGPSDVTDRFVLDQNCISTLNGNTNALAVRWQVTVEVTTTMDLVLDELDDSSSSVVTWNQDSAIPAEEIKDKIAFDISAAVGDSTTADYILLTKSTSLTPVLPTSDTDREKDESVYIEDDVVYSNRKFKASCTFNFCPTSLYNQIQDTTTFMKLLSDLQTGAKPITFTGALHLNI